MPTPDGVTALWSFEESWTPEGGGPSWDLIETINGDPVYQALKQNTAYKYTQSGTIVGYLGYPWLQVPPPLYPAFEMANLRIGPAARSPRRTGSGGNTNYKIFPITYTYRFKSVFPLVGIPHFWPV